MAELHSTRRWTVVVRILHVPPPDIKSVARVSFTTEKMTSATQEEPSDIDTFYRLHTVNVYSNILSSPMYDRMRELEATGEHTTAEINSDGPRRKASRPHSWRDGPGGSSGSDVVALMKERILMIRGDTERSMQMSGGDDCWIMFIVDKKGRWNVIRLEFGEFEPYHEKSFTLIMITNVISLIKLRVAFHAINARRLPLAPLVYTLARPPMTTSSANNSVFRGFFEKQKLTGPNFIDWYRQLRIVLSIEDNLNYLEQPIPHALVAPEGQLVALEITAAHTAWIKGSKEIAGLMLMTMEPEIQ
ncbi:hypothetical protein Tco_0799611 [Tanacetum coccineum]|uniref:Zinc finger, CCHC-type n=1 Tax=Tanacetum coccineum TaxID=301880 RepID=A0ABQ4ZUW6_9ASTR